MSVLALTFSDICIHLFIFYLNYLLLKLIYNKVTSRHPDLPPGPWNLPIVGYLPFIDPSKPYATLSKLADRYGPVYGLWLGSVYTVVLSQSSIIRQVLAKDSTTGRAPLYVTHGIMKGYGLICAEGDLWRDQRKFVANFLRQLGAQKHGPKRDRLAGIIQNQVKDLIDYLKPIHNSLDPCDAIRHNLGSFVNQIVFGKSWPRNDDTWIWLQHLQEEGVKHIGIAGPLNFLPFLSSLSYYQKTMNFLLDGKKKTHELYRKIIEERDINKIDQNNITNLLDAFLLEREARKGSEDFKNYYNYQQFYHLLADIFGAALDTTLTTIRWFFLYMAINPTEQSKLHRSLDSVCGAQSLSLTDLPFLPYLEASIMETQRIRSVVPLGIPHGTTTDGTIIEFNELKYRLPIGTMIVPLQWKVHGDCLSEDGKEIFKPSRFMEYSADAKPMIRKNVDDFMPFQLGKRMCVGDELARMMLFLFCGGVLQAFTINVSDEETVDMTGECGITLTPKPCKLVFKYRDLK